LIKKETTQVLVALHRDRVVAYSIAETHQRPPLFEQNECGLISDLAVKSSYRRKGIGEKLLQEMLKWFAARGLRRIELRVLSANEVGYNFWKKQGFRDYMHILYLDVS
jgi:ribosomal protein S18 acetylase RimI-like enzyme